MIDMLRQWVTGITYACVIVAVAQALTPKGSVEKVLRFTGGMIIILVVAVPLLRIDAVTISDYLSEYRIQMEQYSTEMEEDNEDMMKSIVAAESEKYLLEKTQQLGLSCSFEVYCAMSEEGYPIPYVVHIHGVLTEEEQMQIMQIIVEDFAITADKQFFHNGEGEETNEGD